MNHNESHDPLGTDPDIHGEEAPGANGLTREIQKTVAAVYQRKLGVKDYMVLGASPETTERWKKEIEELVEALKSRDRAKIGPLIVWKHAAALASQRPEVVDHINGIAAIAMDPHLTEEEFTLLAIGLWSMRERSEWKGVSKAALKLLKGGTFTLEGFLEKEGKTNCLDHAILIHQLTKMFGIKGNIYVVRGSRFLHRVWISEDGHVIDISYGKTIGGLFKSREEFQEFVSQNRNETLWNRINFVYEKESYQGAD